jgi:hypothetical protein
VRLIWSTRALQDLRSAAEWSPAQAAAVVNAIEWMSEAGFSLGRDVPDKAARYWPVPPLGVFYRVEGDSLYVLEVIDVRRRREPW